MKTHRGVLILVFGILGLVVCAPFGIAAWIMGSGDLKQMDAGQMDPGGRGMTQAGRICGIVATVLLAIGVVVGVLLFALGVLGAAASAR
jgi:Flp pilus assembly protein protease CpaA